MEMGIQFMLIAIVLSAIGLTWAISSHGRQAGFGASLWTLVEMGVTFFLMMGMLYVAATQVIVRYWLSDYLTLPWTEELSRLLLVWAAFWGAAVLQRSDDHIKVTLLSALLSPRAQLVVRLFGDLVALVLLTVVVWHGWGVARSLLEVSTITLGTPVAAFAYSVPVCCAMMIVSTIRLMRWRIQSKPIQSILEERI